MNVKQPRFEITYNGKNITQDLTQSLINVTYSDHEKDESDEVEFSFEDTEALWRDNWYPAKGDKISLRMGYDDVLLDCGDFEVDEVEATGPPDVVRVRAIGSGVTTAMRTRDSYAHEQTTLKEIAQRFAKKHGLTIVGQILTLRIERSTQNREPDLVYLKRLADEYGYLFSIKGKQLVFTSVFDIEKGLPVYTLDRQEMINYRFLDKTVETFKKAKVAHHNPRSKEVLQYEQLLNQLSDGTNIEDTAEDTLELRTSVENLLQAELKAKSALHNKNKQGKTGRFNVYGNPLLVAGNNIEVTGMGKLSGKYHISESVHTIDRNGGYVTNIEGYKVAVVPPAKHKPKPVEQAEPEYKVRTLKDIADETFGPSSGLPIFIRPNE